MDNPPLEGVKVLDLTHVLAGPFATMILADLGAEIVKIEKPGVGDDSRTFGPFIKNESVYFMSLNRNKKSVTLNLKTEKGRNIFLKLVEKFDVVVENFRPGVMEKLGLGYDVLRRVNSSIIYVSCSGFGSYGPYANKPAYDIIIQGMGGIMSITGEPGRPPVRVGTSISDIVAGLFTAISIISALYKRNLTGEGCRIDVSMLDCQVAILENALARYLATGKVPEPLGSRHPSITPFEAFKTKNGYVIVAVGNNKLWKKFCEAIKKTELISDQRFKNNELRTKNYNSLKKILSKILAEKTTEEWIKIFEEKGIPCGPINTVDKLLNDPQIKARQMIVEIFKPKTGKIKAPASPIKFSNFEYRVRFPPPNLGEHTAEILKKFLSLTDQQIKKLREEKVI